MLRRHSLLFLVADSGDYNVLMVAIGANIPTERFAGACRRAGVKRPWLFGSAVHSERAGDIDVLVETTQPVGLLALGGLQMDLADAFGKPVHLTTLGGVPKRERSLILAEAVLQYAA